MTLAEWNQHAHLFLPFLSLPLVSPFLKLEQKKKSRNAFQKKSPFNEKGDLLECQGQEMKLHSLLLNQAWAVKESHNVEKSFLFSAPWWEIAACHYQAQETLGTVIFRAAGGEITYTHSSDLPQTHTYCKRTHARTRTHAHSPFVALQSTFWQQHTDETKESDE